jgi:hypothetical protein
MPPICKGLRFPVELLLSMSRGLELGGGPMSEVVLTGVI